MSSLDAGVSPIVLVMAPFGIVIVLAAMGGWWGVSSYVEVDKAARTITMRGVRWRRRRWQLTRPLSDVVGVEVVARYVGRGQRTPFAYIDFVDGTRNIAFSPAAYRPQVLRERIAKLIAAVRPPAA